MTRSPRSMVAFAMVLAVLSHLCMWPTLAQPADRLDEINQQVIDLYNRGLYKDAAPVAAQYVALARARHGEDHPRYADAIGWQALVQWQQGQYAGVEPLLRRALAIYEKAFGPEHTSVARGLNDLGSFYQVVGRFNDGEPLMKRALAIDEKLLGPEHAVVGRNCNNLGLMYLEHGRYTDAEPLLLRALAIGEKVLGPDHPSIGIRLRNLATLYREQARYADAEPLMKRALAIDEKALGTDHPAVAQSLGVLGKLYRDMARYNEAETQHKRALAIREKVFGEDNISTARSMNDLATIYQDIGRHKDAEQLVTRALAIREKALGLDHPDVAASIHVLAGIQEKLGRIGAAEPLYRRALAIQQKALGSDHPDLATTQANLGGLYKAIGRHDDAQPLLEGALAIREKVLGAEHPAIASSLVQVGELYRLRGRRDDAEKLFRRARTIRRFGLKEVPIFFATDRKRDVSANGVAFGTERDSDKVTLGLAKVSVLRTQPTTRAVRQTGVQKRSSDLEEVIDVRRIAIQSLDIIPQSQQMIDAAGQQQRAARIFKNQALLFVHGYNVSFESAVRRTGQIALDLDFDGPAFVFSWPSREKLVSYFDDRETVDIATEHLKEFLQTVIADTKAAKVHIVAHSMGNLVLLRALGSVGGASSTLGSAIGEIINAAPDTDPDTFRQFAARIKASGGNLTVYASAADWALRVSGWFRSRPRVGYVLSGKPALISGVDTIDITNAGMNLFSANHNVYASSPIIIGDMRRILAGERPPDKRTDEFKPISSELGTYWYYRRS